MGRLLVMWCCTAIPLFGQPAVRYFSVGRDSAAQKKSFYLNNADEIEEYANRLFNRGEFAAALVYYDRLISVQPQEWRFYFERARCREELQAFKEALADYDYALMLNPNFAEALFSRAHLRFRLGQYGFTITDTDKLLSLPEEKMPPTGAVYFVQTDQGAAGLFSMNDRKVQTLRLRAKAKEKTGNLIGAIEDYTAAIGERQTADADLYYARGKLYEQLGKTDEAQQDFRRALAKDPQHHGARLAAATDKELSEKLRLQAIIDEQPDNAAAFARRGLLLLEEKQYAAALADFDSAERYGYRQAALYVNRGIAKEKLNRTNEALADFSQAVRLDPTPKTYNLRANCYFKKGDYEKAVADYTRSLALDASQADVYYNRGITHYRAKQKAQACRDLQTASALGNPTAQAALEKLCR